MSVSDAGSGTAAADRSERDSGYYFEIELKKHRCCCLLSSARRPSDLGPFMA